MNPVAAAPAGVAFGRFRVLPHRREVLADGQPIKLGGRAFDVLMALIEARGAIVGKNALMALVWADRVVEEHNLEAQISALRVVFGADRNLIRTVSGRGYQFTGKIRELWGSPDVRAAAGMAAGQPAAALPPTNLPAPVSELIGRDAEVAEVVSLIGAHRLVSLIGAGGIGKTQLALAAARQMLPHFADGVWLAGFSPLADPGLVPATVAAAVGLELAGGEASAQRVARALADRSLLLVLDTCEHVIDAAAGMAEALLRASPAAQVIATSREPLRAEGEWAYPVPPLAVPSAEGDDPWQNVAVRLFVVRARASGAHLSEDRHVAAVTGAICRRLDGIPLAIELAAARVAMLGVEQVASGLDDLFGLLTGGRRTALPRHRTLRATLDWSYELLPEPERVVLRRLSVFAGNFSLEAAAAVATGPEIARSEGVEVLSNLVAKSLVLTESNDRTGRYRLLDTTRAYALEKLAQSGELDAVARRHAEFYRDLFEERETRPTAEWLADYGWRLDNLRAALGWAFSPNGDSTIGVALTAAAVPLWMHLALLDECRSRAEQALAALATVAEPDARREMKLLAALGASRLYTRGGVPEVASAWTKALELAESLEDTEYQKHSVWGLWSFHVNGVDYRASLSLAHRFASLAATSLDAHDRSVGERMIAVSHHNLGDQQRARRYIERALAEAAAPGHQRQFIRLELDPRVTARVHLARVLWLQGFADHAMREAEHSVADARAAEHAISFSYALHRAACPIALWTGDLTAAESYAGTLLDHWTRHALPRWHAWGRGHQGALAVKRGDVAGGLRLLRAGFDEFSDARSAFGHITLLGTLAEALGRAEQIADGLVTIEQAIARSERTEERWPIAELLRIKGELLLLQGAQGAAATAEDHFRQALGWARRQGALAWELRAGTSLARLLRDQGRSADALTLLQPVYDRFTEGFDTADLKTAKALLDALP